MAEAGSGRALCPENRFLGSKTPKAIPRPQRSWRAGKPRQGKEAPRSPARLTPSEVRGSGPGRPLTGAAGGLPLQNARLTPRGRAETPKGAAKAGLAGQANNLCQVLWQTALIDNGKRASAKRRRAGPFEFSRRMPGARSSPHPPSGRGTFPAARHPCSVQGEGRNSA